MTHSTSDPSDSGATGDLTVGFLGLGVMGAPMVERLLDRGVDVVVWNRTPSRCDSAVARGARRVDTPAAAMRLCDVVGLCVTDGAAAEGIAGGVDGLLAPGVRPTRARHVVDFSTIDPALAVSLAQRARDVGIDWIDCPVSGGVPAARAGTLIGFGGADDARLVALRPITDPLFARVTPMGGPGSGQLAKLCNQAIVASSLLVMAETLAAARALGMDPSRLPAALAGGFADSRPLQLFGPRMAEHAFEPKLGAVGLMRKDVRLALAQASGRGVDMPMLRHAAALYDRIGEHAEVGPDDDICTLIRLFESTPVAPPPAFRPSPRHD